MNDEQEIIAVLRQWCDTCKLDVQLPHEHETHEVTLLKPASDGDIEPPSRPTSPSLPPVERPSDIPYRVALRSPTDDDAAIAERNELPPVGDSDIGNRATPPRAPNDPEPSELRAREQELPPVGASDCSNKVTPPARAPNDDTHEDKHPQEHLRRHHEQRQEAERQYAHATGGAPPHHHDDGRVLTRDEDVALRAAMRGDEPAETEQERAERRNALRELGDDDLERRETDPVPEPSETAQLIEHEQGREPTHAKHAPQHKPKKR